MAISKNSPENLLAEIIKLNPIEFLGICKIVGVPVLEEVDVEDDVEVDVEGGRAYEDANATRPPRDFYDIWNDLCDAVGQMNRVRRRNLGRLVYAATKKEK